ncbi:MAG: acyltransferase family protein [Leptotrichia hongkongensis]|jgi:putative acyltransferase|nr:acyltransferase family protein [Leptotrichia hongkongensis]
MAIDIIRIFAFVFIVFLHTLNRQFGVDVWMGGYAIISIGVNLFIMISGYLLLDKTEETIVFFKKRILNILPLFLVFNIIYIYFGKIPIMPILKGKAISASHFWYIYMILGLYLLTPWLQKVLKYAEKETLFVVFLWFLCNILNPYLRYFNLAEIPFSNFPLTGFIGYYILGYFVKKYDNKVKRTSFILIIVIYALGFLLSFLSTKYVLAVTGKRVSDFFDKNSLGTFIMTISFFVFWCKFNFSKRDRIIKIVADSTYFAFLVHLIVLHFVIKISDEMIFKSVMTIGISIILGILYNLLKQIKIKN